VHVREITEVANGATFVASDDGEALVRRVHLAESVSAIDAAPEGSLVVMTAAAAADLPSYRLDVLIRRAGARQVHALAIPAAELPLASTARELARRAGMAVVRLEPDADIAAFVTSVDRAIGESVAASVERAARALETFREEPDDDEDIARLVDALSAAVGDVTTDASRDEGVVVPVREGETLGAPSRGDLDDVVTELVLRLAALRVELRRARAETSSDAPIRSRSELLTEFLASGRDDASVLLQRARELGIAIDGWHVAVAITAGARDDGGLGDDLARAAIDVVRAAGGQWHRARSRDALVLVRTFPRDPGPAAGSELRSTIERVVERLASSGGELRAGIGGAHLGPAGMRISLEEARTALYSGATGSVALFDAVGFRKTVVEWYASESAKEIVRTVLAPVDALSEESSRELIETLDAYLSCQGSVTEAASRLFIHRNTVTYRMRKARELLEVDLTDPEQRLAVQMACRARLETR
jgi:sugar diacid utilization regulator